MEIREWIRSLGDRARLLVVIPLAAGSIAALLTLLGPASYQASATLIIPEDPQAGSITGVTAQRVADFTAAVRSEGVLDAVSRETGVPRGDLGSISISRAGSSGVLVITFTGQTAEGEEGVGTVAQTVTRTALATIARSRVDAAQAELDAAVAGVDAANDALIERQEELGLTYSALQLEQLQRMAVRLGNIRDRQARDGEIEQAADTSERLEQKQTRINEMLQLQSMFQRVQAANQVVFSQQGVLFDAQGALTAADTANVQVTGFTRVGKLQEAARRFIFVAAIGFLLALALVLLLQLMDRRSGADTDEVADSDPRRRPAA